MWSSSVWPGEASKRVPLVCRDPGGNDRALALSPILPGFAVRETDGFVSLCGSCRRAQTSSRLAAFVPPMPNDYAAALVDVPFQRLHTLSFIEVNYKLTTNAYGYVEGEFDRHALLHGPILGTQGRGVLRPFSPPEEAAFEHVKDALVTQNRLYQYYETLQVRESNRALELPHDAWEHIVDNARARDPVTDRHEAHLHAAASVDVHATTSHLNDILEADVGAIVRTGDPMPVASVVSKKSLLYKDGLAVVGDRVENVEHLLFPYLFPHGEGSFDRVTKMFKPEEYLRHRCCMAFSPFTLFTPYLLLLRGMELTRSALSAAYGKHVVNEKAYKREVSNAPEGTSIHARILQRLLKHRISDRVDGSPQSFKIGKRNLDAMVRARGLPSHFVTITMNESGMQCGPEYAIIDQLMAEWHHRLSCQDAPVECNRAFVCRFQHVFDNYIMSGPEIFGPVIDYAIRYECQGRGSLHVHMCIWLRSPEDVAALDTRIVAFVPATWDSSTEQFVPPHEGTMQHRLYEHAINKQIHKCRDGDNSRGCIKNGHCSRHFPQPIHANPVPALRDCVRRYMYQCPRPCDQYVVPFLPDLALLCHAHVNIVKIVAEDWSVYLLKYSCKQNPTGLLILTPDDLLRLGFRDVDLNVYQRAVAMHFATHSIYQPAQLALLCSKTPTFAISRIIKFIDMRRPSLRTRMVNSAHEHATMRLDSQAAYEQRPTWDLDGVCMRDMACATFHELVETCTKSELQHQCKVNTGLWADAQAAWDTPHGFNNRRHLCPLLNASMKERFLGVSHAGLAYLKRPAAHIVRFPFIDPRKDMESFAFMLLCELMPFDTETQLLQGYHTYGQVAIAAGLIDTVEKLSYHVARHCKYVYTSDSVTQEQIANMLDCMTEPADPGALPPTAAVFDLVRAHAMVQEVSAALPHNLQLDESQSHTFDALAPTHTRGLHIITGGPGCGKSVLAKLLIQVRGIVDGIVCMASTNEAARMLCSFADTVHASCKIPATGAVLPPYRCDFPHAQALATCHTFIWDEFSQSARRMFDLFLVRVAQAQAIPTSTVLQQNTVILIGDICRLPPVCRSYCKFLHEICPEHNLAAHPLFEEVFTSPRCHVLSVNHRNPAFSHTLEIIRSQHVTALTQGWVDNNINALCRVVTPTPCMRLLCSHRIDVCQYNTALLHAFAESASEEIVHTSPSIRVQQHALGAGHMHISIDDLRPAERAWVDEHKQNTLHHLCIDARVRFTATTDKTRGLVNGATGTVRGFNYRNGRLTGIRVQMDRSDATVSVNRLMPVGSIVVDRYISTSFWPLAPLYASTVHSVQGASLNAKIGIDLRCCFVPGLAYTALSRNTNSADIYLMRPLSVYDLRVPDLLKFYDARARGDTPLPLPRR